MNPKPIILKSEEFIKQDNGKLKLLKNFLSSKKDNSHLDKLNYSKVITSVKNTIPPGANLDKFRLYENKACKELNYIEIPRLSWVLSGGWGYSKNDCIILEKSKEPILYDKDKILIKLVLSRILYEWDYFDNFGISVFYPLTGELSKYTIYEYENKILLNIVYRCLGQTHDEFQIVYGASHDCEDYWEEAEKIKKTPKWYNVDYWFDISNLYDEDFKIDQKRFKICERYFWGYESKYI